MRLRELLEGVAAIRLGKAFLLTDELRGQHRGCTSWAVL